MSKPTRISDQLRQAVEAAEISRYAISRRTGIAQSILSRFVNRGAGLSLENIDKLGECLGLRVVSAGTAGKAKKPNRPASNPSAQRKGK